MQKSFLFLLSLWNMQIDIFWIAILISNSLESYTCWDRKALSSTIKWNPIVVCKFYICCKDIHSLSNMKFSLWIYIMIQYLYIFLIKDSKFSALQKIVCWLKSIQANTQDSALNFCKAFLQIWLTCRSKHRLISNCIPELFVLISHSTAIEISPGLLVKKWDLPGFAYRKLPENHWNTLLRFFSRISTTTSVFKLQKFVWSGVISIACTVYFNFAKSMSQM